jgi:hypothetical protein
MSWNGFVQVGPIPADRNVTGALMDGEQISQPHGQFHPCAVCNLVCACGDIVCQKEKNSVGPFATHGFGRTLDGGLVVTEKVAEMRKASRSRMEGVWSSPSSCGHGAPLRNTCPGSTHAPHAQIHSLNMFADDCGARVTTPLPDQASKPRND